MRLRALERKVVVILPETPRFPQITSSTLVVAEEAPDLAVEEVVHELEEAWQEGHEPVVLLDAWVPLVLEDGV